MEAVVEVASLKKVAPVGFGAVRKVRLGGRECNKPYTRLEYSFFCRLHLRFPQEKVFGRRRDNRLPGILVYLPILWPRDDGLFTHGYDSDRARDL